ncbi:MAG: hypothetical protein E6R03_04060 [Hyphomicrobiaceae bacterium]|nr:MAG: hypothetical protein E6R03_04060 [Hyphomicrobiaceae bacterium]
MKRYYRQLITKDGIKGPLEEMKGKELKFEEKRALKIPIDGAIHEPDKFVEAVAHYRTYRYRRQVECVVFEYEEE